MNSALGMRQMLTESAVGITVGVGFGRRVRYAAFRRRIRPRPKGPLARSNRVAGSGTAVTPS
jgi:hypothetical protein